MAVTCKFDSNIVQTAQNYSFMWSKNILILSKAPSCLETTGQPPRAFEFLENLCSNSPLLPEAEKLFKCPIIGPFQVIKCPRPRETIQYLLLCSGSSVWKHGLIDNTLTSFDLTSTLFLHSQVRTANAKQLLITTSKYQQGYLECSNAARLWGLRDLVKEVLSLPLPPFSYSKLGWLCLAFSYPAPSPPLPRSGNARLAFHICTVKKTLKRFD